ncbi:hypothetical protein [Nocardia brasiliensis]|uniref:hypothetical protein n=1 Tax=Nocardia brasiliensis TaxID=37326 RepID=UPI002456E35F|nr:hypothetical protein [Nocardia brasiliensis]
MFRFDDGGGVDPAYYESIQEEMQVGEITEAVRSFANAVYDNGRSDEEIERFAAEFEAICQQLQRVAPFVYYGEALENFKKNARGNRT